MVDDPAAHPWSSYFANALGQSNPLLTPHAAFLVLGGEPTARSQAYRALFTDALSDETVTEIWMYLQQQRALGMERFRARVEAELRRFARTTGVSVAQADCR